MKNSSITSQQQKEILCQQLKGKLFLLRVLAQKTANILTQKLNKYFKG